VLFKSISVIPLETELVKSRQLKMEQNRFSWEFNIIFVSMELEGTLFKNRLFFPEEKKPRTVSLKTYELQPLTRFAHQRSPGCCDTSI